MTQIVIDVNGTPTLFSPVPAHSLRRGDRFAHAVSVGGARRPTRLVLSHITLCLPSDNDLVVWMEHLRDPRVMHLPTRDAMTVFTRSHPHLADGHACRLPSNLTVLRAVGANSGCGGSR